ncbi:hypothetical protein PAECIP111892_03457 [Paenibacillus auburnensis]|uniref:LPXTG cell wall anchor domain-containing protein n=1 Tax=Paenibacillus auburnensis TaxID=2905649 RepID=A0ABM9CCU3_9BACL|nr:hypothetical protein [Paenibacillus auburnensis]CAH1210297.1 hypothetical protein PAECIP111892_03457 [Paenibacillus auburnensis]
MKKRYHMTIIGAYILIVLIGVIWHAGGVSAEDTIKLTVNSHTKSTAIMSNMQPGDKSASEYTVINEGSEPFDYFVDFEFLSGDVDLYNILQMTLQKEGVILYSGVMSQAEGRVAIGSLPGGGTEAIQMDVVFPAEAGNEFQGKKVGVAFNFTASASPQPSTEPSPTPSASASPGPSDGASPTPSSTVSPNPSSSPSPAPTFTSIPGGSQPPSSSPAPSATSAVTATPGTDEVTVTDAPVPLGGGDNAQATPSPDSGSIATGSSPTPSADPGVTVDDDELPLSPQDGGDKLPDTAEPWYNLILISMAVAILSIIVLRRLNSKK